MSPAAVGSALPVLGTVGIMGLFLPSIETAWNARPDDGADACKVRRGEQVYICSAVAVGLLAGYAQGSAVPVVLCAAFALLVVGVYEHALGSQPSRA